MSIIDNLDAQLWVERYRPTKVEDTILPDRIKNVLREYATSKQIRSYTAIGSAGSGKTRSLVNVLSRLRDAQGHRLHLNAQKIHTLLKEELILF